MQWILIEEQEEIGNVITAGSLAIWPRIVGIGIKQGWWKRRRSRQKRMEVSKLSAGLLKFVQCIAPRKIGQ